MIKTLNIPEEKLTRELLAQYLREGLFYEVREMRKSSQPQEIQDKLDSALDGTPDGFSGVQMLYSRLMGTGYELVTKPNGKTDYVKKAPEDVHVIYEEVNKLIEYVNGLEAQTMVDEPGEE